MHSSIKAKRKFAALGNIAERRDRIAEALGIEFTPPVRKRVPDREVKELYLLEELDEFLGLVEIAVGIKRNTKGGSKRSSAPRSRTQVVAEPTPEKEEIE